MLWQKRAVQIIFETDNSKSQQKRSDPLIKILIRLTSVVTIGLSIIKATPPNAPNLGCPLGKKSAIKKKKFQVGGRLETILVGLVVVVVVN